MENIQRLEVIIQLLQNRPHISKTDILDYFERKRDYIITSRTLERDFNRLKTKFGIHIKYNRAHNGYSLQEEDEEQISYFLNLTGRVVLGDLLKTQTESFKKYKNILKLESSADFTGLHHIKSLLTAILQNREIKFSHYNYRKKTETEYRLFPLQIREYKRRLYVVGHPISRKSKPTNQIQKEHLPRIQCFGLDRISQLKNLPISKLRPKDYQKNLDKYKQIIGLNFDESEHRELIRLAVTPNQYKYLESLPLHSSQYKIKDREDGRIEVGIHLIPNYEFKMEILKLGEKIEVLSPTFLRKEIQETLLESLKLYQN